MSETAAGSVPSQDGRHQELRERVTLIAFVVVAVVSTLAWLSFLAWLAIEALRSVGA